MCFGFDALCVDFLTVCERCAATSAATVAVGLAVARDGPLVEGLRSGVGEDGACGHENVAGVAAGGVAYADVDARLVDTLF